MTIRLLKTTTALALVVGLAGPALAQETPDVSGLEPAAALAIVTEERAAAEAAGNADRVAELDALIAELEAQIAAPAAEAEAEAETEAAPSEEPAPEATAEEAPAEEPAPEATAEEAPAEEPAPEATAEEAPAEEPAPEATAEEAPAEEPAPEAQVEAAPVEAEGAGEIEQDTPAETAAAPAAEPEPEVAAPDPQAQADAIAEDDAQATAAAAATGETGASEPQVVEETVTDETARSSGEEFETSVAEGAAAAQAAPARKKDKDDGDDDRQDEILRGAGAALLGLGALAIGDILRPDEQVVSDTGDRLVVERDGQLRVLRNDDALLRQPGSNVTTYRYDDGSTRTVVVREDGSEIETIRARDGRVLRRTRTLPSGESYVLFDDTQVSQDVVISDLPRAEDRPVFNFREAEEDDLARALARIEGNDAGRTFSLNQIRNIDPVRKLMPEINVDTVNFETGSAVIRAEEAAELAALGRAIRDLITENPSEVFLIEGHTDAVGGASYNLALSDRRAESVALALTEYFDVPPENMVIQGYGESDLLVDTQEGERANRRAAVRRITPLLQASR